MAYKDYPFYHGATAFTFTKARELKANSTEAEELLWQQLKAKKFHNLKFRRQHKIITELGLIVIRFKNEEIISDVYSILKRLERFIKQKSSLSMLERE